MPTAPFDTPAFAAVDSFFQKSAASSTGDEAKRGSSSSSGPPLTSFATPSAHSQGSRRQGVGAFVQPPIPLEYSKRILQVGTKRKAVEEEFETTTRTTRDDDDDEDEIGGRTAIVPSSSLSSATPTSVKNESTIQSQKGKKKGKKEREQQQLQPVDHDRQLNDKTFPAVPTGGGVPSSSGTTSTDLNTTAAVIVPKKRKRLKKVRSKQKNICKDHRVHKPPHLLPHYPLTTATRTKLNLPTSRDGREWKGDEHHSDVDLRPLAVERPIPNDDGVSTKSSRKSHKYKNLSDR